MRNVFLVIVYKRFAAAIDVKFLNFKNIHGKTVKRYQYTAIDDATRARALEIYARHTQKNAIDFVKIVFHSEFIPYKPIMAAMEWA